LLVTELIKTFMSNYDMMNIMSSGKDFILAGMSYVFWEVN